MEQFAVVSRILNAAFNKKIELENSQYFNLFLFPEFERNKEIVKINYIINRLLNYQINILKNA